MDDVHPDIPFIMLDSEAAEEIVTELGLLVAMLIALALWLRRVWK